jgi:hypothetical protein
MRAGRFLLTSGADGGRRMQAINVPTTVPGLVLCHH